ncbi:MAG: pyruvate ferredoxin oxidoreductase, partial [Candidatus Methanoperedens sp.]|nr:pyruvate ferredoxin oxidoreductase [Candidatus Methanoperedens sp.]
MRQRMVVVEGSYAVAYAVKVCRPNVISAYPITPQTHIVEDLSQFVADGEMNCEYMNVESEFSAISALIGASASGARTYSSTTSQGLALMHEALFNAAGMRLPIVMTVVN